MDVADDEETGLRAVVIEQGFRSPGSLTPGSQDAKRAVERPNGVAQKAGEVFQAMALALMPLGDFPSRLSMHFKQLLQMVWPVAEGLPAILNPCGRHRGVISPGHDIVKKEVPMGDKHRSAGEIYTVLVRDIRIVVTGDEPHLGRMALLPRLERRLHCLGMLGIGAWADVTGITIENKQIGALQ